MQTSPRMAVPGDICVLAEPAQSEAIQIRQKQEILQSLFGGQLHERVHLTCQRFELSDDSVLPQVIQCLRTQLATVRPFSLAAISLVKWDARFWQTKLLRWRIEVTEETQHLCIKIEAGLEAMDIVPHFRSFSPTLVTALEDISNVNLERGLKEIPFPQHLFTVHQTVLSRILGQRQFEILETMPLARGIDKIFVVFLLPDMKGQRRQVKLP